MLSSSLSFFFDFSFLYTSLSDVGCSPGLWVLFFVGCSFLFFTSLSDVGCSPGLLVLFFVG